MSKFFKNPLKKQKVEQAAPAVPRAFGEIQQEHGQVAAQAGVVQYQAYVMEQELKQLNERLMYLNQEAAARQKLDKETAEQAPKEQVQEGVTQ